MNRYRNLRSSKKEAIVNCYFHLPIMMFQRISTFKNWWMNPSNYFYIFHNNIIPFKKRVDPKKRTCTSCSLIMVISFHLHVIRISRRTVEEQLSERSKRIIWASSDWRKLKCEYKARCETFLMSRNRILIRIDEQSKILLFDRAIFLPSPFNKDEINIIFEN